MENRNPILEIFGYILLIAAMVFGLILMGIWIPKVGFMPKVVSLRVYAQNTRDGSGFLIQNPHEFGIREVVIDINGSRFSQGYTCNVGFIPGGNETSWVKCSALRKDGVPFNPEMTVRRVEVYGYIDNRRCYRQLTPGQVMREARY